MTQRSMRVPAVMTSSRPVSKPGIPTRSAIQGMHLAFGWNLGHQDPIAGFPIKNVGNDKEGCRECFSQPRNFATRIQGMHRAFGWNLGHQSPTAGFPIKNVGNDRGGLSGMTRGLSGMTGGLSGMTGGLSGMTGGLSGMTGGCVGNDRGCRECLPPKFLIGVCPRHF